MDERAKELKRLFPDLVVYIDDEGQVFNREGEFYGGATLFRFPQEFSYLDEDREEKLKEWKISRVITLDTVIQKFIDGYRVYPLQKTEAIVPLAFRKRISQKRKGLKNLVPLKGGGK